MYDTMQRTIKSTKLQINSLTLRNFRDDELTARAGNLIPPSENTRCPACFLTTTPAHSVV
jgi:hypothetical protein